MKKRALIIGIDDYPLLSSWDNLHGSVNDARAMAGLLGGHFGFAEGDLRMLLSPSQPRPGSRDGLATRGAILAAIDDLIAETGPEDIAVITYSGHGTQVKDTSGDEPDGWDEALVPCDGGYSARGVVAQPPILDDEIHERLLRLEDRTAHVTVIFDCCNSGSAIRDPFGDRVRGLPRDSLSASGPAPAPAPAAASRGWVPGGDRYVFIAASMDGECAHEGSVSGAADGVVHGVLTSHLVRELSAAAPGTSMRSAFERVRARMAAEQPWQHPHAEGALDREIFGVLDVPATRSVPLVSCAGDWVTLDAGAIHGVTSGSVWGIHKVVGGAPTGQVEITEVRGARADARIVSGQDAMVVGDLAVEVAHRDPPSSFSVGIQAGPGLAAPAAELERLLGDLGQAGPGADARVYALAPRGAASPGDPVPQIGTVAAPLWAVVGRDGQLLLPALPLAPGSAVELCTKLQGLALVRRVAAMTNADPRSGLAGRVALRLLRRAAGTSDPWAAAEPGPNGLVELGEGDQLAVEVQSSADRAVYIGLFDLDPNGEVDLMHGPDWPGSNEAFAPGARTRHGCERPATVHVPEGYPPDPGGANERVEVVKLFATTAETDFSLLAPGRSSYPARPGLVAGLLRAAMSSDRDGDVVPAAAPDEDWTTASVAFVVRRKGAEASRAG